MMIDFHNFSSWTLFQRLESSGVSCLYCIYCVKNEFSPGIQEVIQGHFDTNKIDYVQYWNALPLLVSGNAHKSVPFFCCDNINFTQQDLAGCLIKQKLFLRSLAVLL